MKINSSLITELRITSNAGILDKKKIGWLVIGPTNKSRGILTIEGGADFFEIIVYALTPLYNVKF